MVCEDSSNANDYPGVDSIKKKKARTYKNATL